MTGKALARWSRGVGAWRRSRDQSGRSGCWIGCSWGPMAIRLGLRDTCVTDARGACGEGSHSITRTTHHASNCFPITWVHRVRYSGYDAPSHATRRHQSRPGISRGQSAGTSSRSTRACSQRATSPVRHDLGCSPISSGVSSENPSFHRTGPGSGSKLRRHLWQYGGHDGGAHDGL